MYECGEGSLFLGSALNLKILELFEYYGDFILILSIATVSYLEDGVC